MSVSEELVDFTILGRNIGKGSGWDEVGDQVIHIYDFIPSSDYKGPIGQGITFDPIQGTITACDSEGKATTSMDVFEALADMSKAEKDV